MPQKSTTPRSYHECFKDDNTCDARLVPFAQFKRREKHPWRSVTLSKVAACNFTKSNTLPWVLFTFLKL